MVSAIVSIVAAGIVAAEMENKQWQE